ncbi:MAG TPA: TraB/GumN family protein [Gammaproteobacteria bacterium]
MTDRLLTGRNRIMVERMLPLVESGDAFVAVGAMHLPGADGILALLRERGFTIERVY